MVFMPFRGEVKLFYGRSVLISHRHLADKHLTSAQSHDVNEDVAFRTRNKKAHTVTIQAGIRVANFNTPNGSDKPFVPVLTWGLTASKFEVKMYTRTGSDTPTCCC